MVKLYHRLIPHCAVFENCKSALANATLLLHSQCDAQTSVTSDASDQDIWAVLEPFIDHEWRPIAFFSRKLKPKVLDKVRSTVNYWAELFKGRLALILG